ncbi:MAG: hypothetical protein ACRDRK_06220 [Pseudonocardia sp.]
MINFGLAGMYIIETPEYVIGTWVLNGVVVLLPSGSCAATRQHR